MPYLEPAQRLGSYLVDNQKIAFGNTTLTALHTPGHSPGSHSLYNKEAGVVFVGDVLFNGSIGRTDFVRGEYATLIRSIEGKLLTMPDDTVVYSGHGTKTTIGAEREFNPFL